MSQRTDPPTDDAERQLPAGRKAALAQYVNSVGQVSVAALAKKFDVSVDTIRRDLDQLDSEGALVRTHGGAVSLTSFPRPDPSLATRAHVAAAAKDAMGAVVAGLIPDGASLIVNAGTSTLGVIRHLKDHRDLTIATNSLAIPAEISPTAVRDLYVFGGSVRISAHATVGPIVFPTPDGRADVPICCDYAIIAVGAVHADYGYSTSNIAEASMMAEMASRATRVIVLADSSKFDRHLFAQIGALGIADWFVTDAAPPPDLAKEFEDANVEVMLPA